MLIYTHSRLSSKISRASLMPYCRFYCASSCFFFFLDNKCLAISWDVSTTMFAHTFDSFWFYFQFFQFSWGTFFTFWDDWLGDVRLCLRISVIRGRSVGLCGQFFFWILPSNLFAWYLSSIIRGCSRRRFLSCGHFSGFCQAIYSHGTCTCRV